MAKITRKNLNKHRVELQTLLSEYAKKHNMTIDVGRITFTTDSFRFKAEFVNDFRADELPLIETERSAAEIKRHLNNTQTPVGCKEEWIGQTFRTSPRGGLHTITKFRPNASKNVVVAETERGTKYVWSAAEIKRYLGE